MELITAENDKGRRLDRILRKALPNHPLPLLHRLLRQGQVFVNGKKAKAQDRVESGANISIPALSQNEAKTASPVHKPPSLQAQPGKNSDLPAIIWEGPGLIAFNKPVGLSTCSTGGQASLESLVSSFLAGKLPPSLSFRPGPLHRLDKPSSGIVIFSTSLEGAHLFSELLRERKVKKTYLAIVEGEIDSEQIWQDELIRDKELKKTFVSQKEEEEEFTTESTEDTEERGKIAITNVKPLEKGSNCTLIEAEIATGRTHQIRAQAAFHGHPLLGDKKYGGHGRSGLFLHAWKIEFLDHKIEAPLPDAFKKKTRELFSHMNPNRLAD